MKVTPRSLGGVGIGAVIAITYTLAFRKLGIHHALAFRISLGAYVVIGMSSMVSVYRRYRRTIVPGEKTSLMYLCIGGAVAITLVALDVVPTVGPSLNAFGNIISIIYMYFISQTLFRYRLLDVNEVLGADGGALDPGADPGGHLRPLVAWVPRNFSRRVLLQHPGGVVRHPDPVRAARTAIEGPMQKWMFRERYELKARIDALRGSWPT